MPMLNTTSHWINSSNKLSQGLSDYWDKVELGPIVQQKQSYKLFVQDKFNTTHASVMMTFFILPK